ncbi:hypothetical protein F2Q69_00005861 [Brassica cretica]|uniref:Uncharacterized protein n=1 Tax=Brassica cretica TaxID=69181 RepID=A0A8S9PS10_BRACR|nr:hypothetical protein F2Q69_00005861 [Brassica cretica]
MSSRCTEPNRVNSLSQRLAMPSGKSGMDNRGGTIVGYGPCQTNPAQKPLAGELNRHAGQLAGEVNHHADQLAGELNLRVVAPARELSHRAGQLAGELNRRVVVFAGEFGRHASRLARRVRPDPGLSDLLRLPYLPYICDILPLGPYTSRFVSIKVILKVL